MPDEPSMPRRPVRVAVIDSGVDAAAVGRPESAVKARRFALGVRDGHGGECVGGSEGGSEGATGAMVDALIHATQGAGTLRGIAARDAIEAPAAPPASADLAVRELPPVPDRLGHGTDVARLILAAAPEAELLSAQVFADGRPVSAAAVAAAIDWAVAQGADLINLSLGLREDHWALRHACASASAAGVLLVASTPARGSAVYPAAYPGVVAVTGDARCAEGEWSLLEMPAASCAGVPRAQLGACPDCRPARGGASYAAARISGLAARWRQRQPVAPGDSVLAVRLIEHLAAGAAYRGRERRLPESAA